MAVNFTYVPIQTQTLTSNTNSVTFSSIPSTYKDLVIVISAKVTSGSNLSMKLNGDTGTNYSATYLTGTGSGIGSTQYTNLNSGALDNYGYPDTSGFNITIANVMNYANTNTYKSWLSRSNNPNNGLAALAGLWRSTSAISNIQIFVSSNFVTGSTFTIYGIASA